MNRSGEVESARRYFVGRERRLPLFTSLADGNGKFVSGQCHQAWLTVASVDDCITLQANGGVVEGEIHHDGAGVVRRHGCLACPCQGGDEHRDNQ